MDLAELGACGSDAEGDQQQSDCEEPSAGELSDTDMDPPAECDGCGINSDSMCPISEIKGTPLQVPWARLKRKVIKKIKNGKVIKKSKQIASGKWCRNCFNFWRSNYTHVMKNLEDFDEKVKHAKGGKKKWDTARQNWIRKKAGGQARIRGNKPRASVKRYEKHELALKDPAAKFYTEKAYIKHFGDPKVNKAKPFRFKNKAGKLLVGYVVREGEEGVYTLEGSSAIGVMNSGELLAAEDNLYEDHADEVAQAAQAEEFVANGFVAQSAEDIHENQRLHRLRSDAAATAAVPEDDQSAIPESEPGDHSDEQDGMSVSNKDSDDMSDDDGVGEHMQGRKRKAVTQKTSGKAKAKFLASGLVTPNRGTSSSVPPSPAPTVGASTGGTGGTSSKLTMNADSRKHGHLIIKQLKEAIEGFNKGNWGNLQPRQLQSHVKDLAKHNVAADKFLKALGRLELPAELSELTTLNDGLKCVLQFNKSWNQVSKGAADAALSQAKQLSRATGKPVPTHIMKVVPKKITMDCDSWEGQLRTLEADNPDGAQMVAADDRAVVVQGVLLQVLGAMLDKIKLTSDTDRAVEDFFNNISVIEAMTLPKAIVDDAKAIGVSQKPSASTADVQWAATRLTSKKDQSVFVAMIKRKKLDAWDTCIAKLTQSLRDRQKMESKQQSVHDIVKTIDSTLSAVTPGADAAGIANLVEKFVAIAKRFVEIKWDEVGLERAEVFDPLRQLYAKLTYEILAKGKAPVDQKMKWVTETGEKLYDYGVKVNDSIRPGPQLPTIVFKEILMMATVPKAIVKRCFVGDSEISVELLTVVCLKMGPKDLMNLTKHLNLIELPMPGDWQAVASCMEWPADHVSDINDIIVKLMKMGDCLPEAMLIAVKGFLDMKGDITKFEESSVLSESDLKYLALDASGCLVDKHGIKGRLMAKSIDAIIANMDTHVGIANAYQTLCNKALKTEEFQNATEITNMLHSGVTLKMAIIPLIQSMITLDAEVQNDDKMFEAFGKFRLKKSEALNFFDHEANAELVKDYASAVDNVRQVLQMYADAKEKLLRSSLEKAVKSMVEATKDVEANLVPTATALKKFDLEEMQKVIDHPGRPVLIQAVKAANISFSEWKTRSGFVMGTIDLTDLEGQVEMALKLRDKARTTVAIRSALLILSQKDQQTPTMIEDFFRNLRAAKSSIPAKLRKELEKLAPTATSAPEEVGEEAPGEPAAAAEEEEGES
ncbi:unnamed protein product [Prorocentrum cordatum]|uniref:Uncharacterized protein n=1 Tax=Prorocentrum cordatum TaxID=2364126 RepID=A0ABN9TTN5_9DINO|nr:unnamed protein product [Polarella glacialis]